jgi:cyanophycinase-like exopeptidase
MALVAFVNAELLGGAAFAGTSARAGTLSEPVISTAASGVTMANARALALPRELI